MSGTKHPSTPRRRLVRTATAVAAAALLSPLVTSAPAATASDAGGALQDAYARAAQRYDVPESVLLGVSYLQSRWDGHDGAPSVAGGYGPMHLTDVRRAVRNADAGHFEGGDPRGDSARPMTVAATAVEHAKSAADAAGKPPARLRTLQRASDLTGLSAEQLRTDEAANIQGGAALLAANQKKLGLPASDDPGDWFAAVAKFSGATDAGTAEVYAGDVYDVIQQGASRVTDSGDRVTLPAAAGVSPEVSQLKRLGLKHTKRNENIECPRSISCEWLPAPYEKWTNDDGSTDYGNHDLGNRPTSQSVDYIVLHDTEATWDTTLQLIQDPTYVSWHYTIRSADGHVDQHVPTHDVAWHAGNWFVNAKSVGIEQEGFLVDPDAWFTESMYRNSARLVRYLSHKYDIPMDRQHILGHDNVPGVTTPYIPGMHTDPGPYWDWAHYFDLLGRPFHQSAGPNSGMVMIKPDYDTYQPAYTGCESAGEPCAPHGASAVRLHTKPDADAPLLKDIGLHPKGGATTTDVNDWGARASTGQKYAVAGRDGDWTAIWYGGQKGWFYNPHGRDRTAVPSSGKVVTPKAGKDEIPVYGRAYPEASAYPDDVPVQSVSPLPYTVKAGQEYALGLATKGEYYYAVTYEPDSHQVVRGQQTYYQIQLGQRIAYVKASDVDVHRAR